MSTAPHMQLRTASWLSCVAVWTLITLPAMASGLGLSDTMRDTPLSYFNEEDMNLYQSTLTQSLSEARDNEKRSWSNPKTRSRGEITPLQTAESADGVCRQMEILNSAKGQTSKGTYTFCRQPDGTWKIRTRKKQ